MKIQMLGAVVLVVGILLTCLGGEGFAQQTNQTKATAIPTAVATNFVADAVLSPAEIEQVLTLAKACGLDSPARIETYHVLPGRGKAMRVKSVEHVEGRNTTFDTLVISKKDWGGWMPGKDAKWVGDFWADAGSKYSTLLRRYDFRKESIQIQIGKGVATELADKVMALIETNDVRFGKDVDMFDFDRLKQSKPKRIFPYPEKGGYCIEFNWQLLMMFEWKDDHIFVTALRIFAV